MDSSRFDALTRSLAGSRRLLVSGSLALAPSWLGISAANAKRKRKHKKRRKVKQRAAAPNAFGCIDVGDLCQTAEQCCSGICEGKKGQRTCRAHDTGTCDQDQPGYCAVADTETGACIGSGGINGVCFRATAGNNVCVDSFDCADCRRDADCEALGYPSGAACLPFEGELACAPLCQNGTACGYITPEA